MAGDKIFLRLYTAWLYGKSSTARAQTRTTSTEIYLYTTLLNSMTVSVRVDAGIVVKELRVVSRRASQATATTVLTEAWTPSS